MRERLVASPETVAVQMILNADEPTALAVVDTALRLPRPKRPSLRAIESRVPYRLRHLVTWADPRAESGTESIFRYFLLRAGISFEIQRWLTDEIRVDFVVDGFLVVECISREYHSGDSNFNRDRARITTILNLGYAALEFTYPQIMFEWETVWRTFLRALTQRPATLPAPGTAQRPA